ncbi:MAG: phosphoribosylglycinamide formyltransferase [Demequinaceae bacterium]|nr:phosphoribosylglycinamide formyltransferase [Demequinaceae bacterium]
MISDREEAPALDLARAEGVPVEVVPLAGYADREEWNRALGDAIERYAPDLVVLAGFMKILAPETVGRFAGRMINTHPALLPAFTGAHAVRDALAHGVKITGCTIHLVDVEVDAGPIVAQAAVAIEEGDTEGSLHERIKAVERGLVVDTVRRLLKDGWTVEGRRVRCGTSEGKKP